LHINVTNVIDDHYFGKSYRNKIKTINEKTKLLPINVITLIKQVVTFQWFEKF